MNNKMEKSSILDFFQDTTVFVTGGTGFVGKALLEKLLRSCNGIKTIYVLLRPKHGQNINQRYEELINDQVFDNIRSKNSKVLKKLIPVPGDMGLPFIGLNEQFKTIITNEVNIVFHMASVIKFNLNIADAANFNTIGTQRLLDLCSNIKNLKSFVYASTAYSNIPRKTVYEEVYPTTPLSKDSFLTLVNNLPKELLNKIEDTLKGSHINTYTLTKSMAESVIFDYKTKFPLCIVRPSIITAAISEPYPGWVIGFNGATALLYGIAFDNLCSAVGDENICLDLIPIDIVVNTLIAGAWVNSFSSGLVYNCTSGQLNPIQIGDIIKFTMSFSKRSTRKFYPKFQLHKSEGLHMLKANLFHFAPAYIWDVILNIFGTKSNLYKKEILTECANRARMPFVLKEFNFDVQNLKKLVELTKDAKDGYIFNCDIRKLNWEPYFKNYISGIEKYIFSGKSKL